MPNYKEMYLKLFNEITDTIEHLRQLQRDTEEMYISESPVDLREAEKTE